MFAELFIFKCFDMSNQYPVIFIPTADDFQKVSQARHTLMQNSCFEWKYGARRPKKKIAILSNQNAKVASWPADVISDLYGAWNAKVVKKQLTYILDNTSTRTLQSISN